MRAVSPAAPRTADAFSAYLQDIRRIPRITHEREKELAHLIRSGREEEWACAREELIVANLRLVISIAKKFSKFQNGIDIMELIQEGNIGLARAAELYDPAAGTVFSTYATWWIRQRILRYLNTHADSVIVVPIRVGSSIHKIMTLQSKLSLELQRRVTVVDVANAAQMQVRHVEEVLSFINRPVSLDASVDSIDGTGESPSLHLQDMASVHPEESLLASFKMQELREVIGRLTPREQEVLKRRFGIDHEEQTLDEVGAHLHICRERVRQIEYRAIARLRRILGCHVTKRSRSRSARGRTETAPD